MAREKKKKKVETRRKLGKIMLSRPRYARKLGVEGWKEDPVNSGGKKGGTMASQSPLRPRSDALFPVTLARFHPADYLRLAGLRARSCEFGNLNVEFNKGISGMISAVAG